MSGDDKGTQRKRELSPFLWWSGIKSSKAGNTSLWPRDSREEERVKEGEMENRREGTGFFSPGRREERVLERHLH